MEGDNFIWIDGDNFPLYAQRILVEQSSKYGLKYLVCYDQNTPIEQLNEQKKIKDMSVDEYILKHIQAKQWLISQDLPLQKKVRDKGAHSFNMQGKQLSDAQLDQRIKQAELVKLLTNNGLLYSKEGKKKKNNQQREKYFRMALEKIGKL